ncbi:hypothetical protein BDQ17DRAFT_959852 [Cyathus striatus]|nr:hypothetical protein BDQ17DRAFT_959852 [Cyathus striatus]
MTALRLYNWAYLTPRILCAISVHPRSTKEPVRDTFPFFGPSFSVGDTLGKAANRWIGPEVFLLLFECNKYKPTIQNIVTTRYVQPSPEPILETVQLAAGLLSLLRGDLCSDTHSRNTPHVTGCKPSAVVVKSVSSIGRAAFVTRSFYVVHYLCELTAL